MSGIIEWAKERVRRWREWAPSAGLGVGAWLAMAVLAFLLMGLLSAAFGAERERGEWMPDASAYLYVERPWDDPGVCWYKPSDLTSNLGADVTIYRRGVFEWHVRVTHHSCAFGRDGNEYNAAGTGIVLRFRR